VAFVVALIRLVFMGDVEIFSTLVNSTFDMAKTGFELSLGFTGVMTLWLGLMRIGENGGMINVFARIMGPFFNKLFPEIPKNHPVNGSIMMNLAANMLGLDNAATPLGLKAMTQLQEINPDKTRASNPMIMFLVLNTSGLTLIPVSIMVYRAQLGAADPSDIFLPILIATFFSTLAGIVAVSIYQRINLFNRVFIAYFSIFSLIISGLIWYFVRLPRDQVNTQSALMANIILLTIIILFIVMALRKKVNVYESFIDGAREGFTVAIKIIPYLVAILVGVGLFRASGALDFLIHGLGSLFAAVGFDTRFVDALPTAFMKPLSGSGARGVMIETMKSLGPDSFAGRLACTFQGSCDTTFYILAVYFGSVGITKTRHALACGLLADLAGVIAAIFVAYLFWGYP
jgi:spore maturation protein SpmA/spore maturation protein SpmB